MDESQIAALYERFGYFVRLRCLTILGNGPDADDALQEVFLRVQRYRTTSTEEGSELRWLLAIAHRCCFDLKRSRSRQEPLETRDLERLDNRRVGDAVDADTRAFVGAALRRVGPLTREIALLLHVEGYTQEEVAERTGYSRKTVGRKLKSFAERLRRFVREPGTS